MDALYVCLFSNGQVKVGRSAAPEERIAQHADRVACVGVNLIEWTQYPCTNAVVQRETWLIQRCADAATDQFLNEWFAGLDYTTVCGWASEATRVEFDAVPKGERSTFGTRLRDARKNAGLTQADLGRGLAFDGGDLNKAAISGWEVDRSAPNVNQLRLMCERLGVSADHLVFGQADQNMNPTSCTPSINLGASRVGVLSPVVSGAGFSSKESVRHDEQSLSLAHF